MQAPSSSGSGGVLGPNEAGGVSLKDVIDLAEALRQERLLIADERKSFNHLSDALSQSSNTVNEVCSTVTRLTRNNRATLTYCSSDGFVPSTGRT